MQATRQDILDHLRRNGEATVRDLGSVLRLTATGIRQHLTILERDGLVEARESRGHVGRPALVYSLSAKGAALFPSRYDDLCNLLLAEVRAMAGSKGIQGLLMGVAKRSAEEYDDRLQGHNLGDRVRETTAIIGERGSLVECEQVARDEFLINQYTCPFPNVARSNSGVCALDVEFVRRLTGADARLTRSLLRGDSTCTFRIRPPTDEGNGTASR
jgi:predicted ArsR family transcriptional regulator